MALQLDRLQRGQFTIILIISTTFTCNIHEFSLSPFLPPFLLLPSYPCSLRPKPHVLLWIVLQIMCAELTSTQTQQSVSQPARPLLAMLPVATARVAHLFLVNVISRPARNRFSAQVQCTYTCMYVLWLATCTCCLKIF